MAQSEAPCAVKRDLSPACPLVETIKLPATSRTRICVFTHRNAAGRESDRLPARSRAQGPVPPPATEPPAAGEIASNDELFVTGLHLEQYRHATRCPALYWREALRRDPLDSRCNHALGRWHLKRGEFAEAEKHFRKAIARLTRRNANPYDGEAYYHLGLCLRHLGREDEAYDAFYKACWNQAWQSAGYHALAEIDCCRKNWSQAEEHLERVISFPMQNLRAANLLGLICRARGNLDGARAIWSLVADADRLDWWNRHLLGKKLTCDLQTALDLAHDFARAGFLPGGD